MEAVYFHSEKGNTVCSPTTAILTAPSVQMLQPKVIEKRSLIHLKYAWYHVSNRLRFRTGFTVKRLLQCM